MTRRNELDRIFERDYAVGAGWLLLSICLLAVTVMFDNLKFSLYIPHNEGIGAGQIVLCILWLVNIVLSVNFLLETAEYQQYYGAS